MNDDTINNSIMIPMRFERILDNCKTPFDLYIKVNNKYKEIAKKNEVITSSFKEKCRQMGATSFFVKKIGASTTSPSLNVNVIANQQHQSQNQTQNQSNDNQSNDNIVKFSPEEHKKYIEQKDNYHNISKAIFMPNAEINFSLFEQQGMKINPIVETNSNKFVKVPLLRINPQASLVIKKDDLDVFKQYLNNILKNNKNDNKIETTVVKENTKSNIRSFLSEPLNKNNVLNIVISSNDIINSLNKNHGNNLKELMSLKTTDFHLYNHCLNVAVLAASMARELRLNTNEIESLTLCAMMHDIGKSQLPKIILNKPFQLTADEYLQWKKHVTSSIVVAQNNGLPAESILGIKHHHEKLSGTGYPYGLKGMQISKFGKIMSIVDSYDSLSTPKIGRQPLKSIEVFNILLNDAKKGDLDLEYVKLLIKIVSGK